MSLFLKSSTANDGTYSFTLLGNISIVVLIITIILSIFTIGKVNAKEIISIDGSIENNKLNVSGKAEEGTLAVEIMVYDASNNLVYMESTSVDSDNNFAKTFNVDGNEYTIKVADYDGGNYIEKKNETDLKHETD